MCEPCGTEAGPREAVFGPAGGLIETVRGVGYRIGGERT